MPEIGENNLKYLRNDIGILISGKEDPIDEGFLDLCRKFNARYSHYRMPKFEKREIVPLVYDHTDRTSLLFSGGRVSLATALWLNEMGKDIELVYFMDDKKDSVIELMKQLDLPFTVICEKIPKNHFSGMWMIFKALENAIESHHAPIIYMGYFEYALMENNKLGNWRYCNDFIQTFAEVAKKYIDGVKVLDVMPNYTVVNDVLLKHPEYQFIQ